MIFTSTGKIRPKEIKPKEFFDDFKSFGEYYYKRQNEEFDLISKNCILSCEKENYIEIFEKTYIEDIEKSLEFLNTPFLKLVGTKPINEEYVNICYKDNRLEGNTLVSNITTKRLKVSQIETARLDEILSKEISNILVKNGESNSSLLEVSKYIYDDTTFISNLIKNIEIMKYYCNKKPNVIFLPKKIYELYWISICKDLIDESSINLSNINILTKSESIINDELEVYINPYSEKVILYHNPFKDNSINHNKINGIVFLPFMLFGKNNNDTSIENKDKYIHQYILSHIGWDTKDCLAFDYIIPRYDIKTSENNLSESIKNRIHDIDQNIVDDFFEKSLNEKPNDYYKKLLENMNVHGRIKDLFDNNVIANWVLYFQIKGYDSTKKEDFNQQIRDYLVENKLYDIKPWIIKFSFGQNIHFIKRLLDEAIEKNKVNKKPIYVNIVRNHNQDRYTIFTPGMSLGIEPLFENNNIHIRTNLMEFIGYDQNTMQPIFSAFRQSSRDSNAKYERDYNTFDIDESFEETIFNGGIQISDFSGEKLTTILFTEDCKYEFIKYYTDVIRKIPIQDKPYNESDIISGTYKYKIPTIINFESNGTIQNLIQTGVITGFTNTGSTSYPNFVNNNF